MRMEASEPAVQKRQKNTGHLFIRGNMWYMRYRYRGQETVRTTGVLVDTTDDVEFERSKSEANDVLMKETEVLRLQEKRLRIKVVKVMLESVNEQIKDQLQLIAKDAPLSRLAAAFKSSSRRIDCSESQLTIYLHYIDSLVSVIGEGVSVSAIDDIMAERFAEWLAVGRASSTYNKYLNGLAVIWDAVGPRFGCTENPWKTLPRKHLDTKVRKDLSEAEVEKILSSADGEMKKLIAIGLYTGMRLGDCVHLTWGKIKDGTIFVKTSKTGAEVAIPIHGRLAEILGEKGEASDMICPSLAMSYDSDHAYLSKKTGRLFRKCGVQTSEAVEGKRARALRGFHSLRHTFVSRCISSGISPHIVQALVGHSSAKMTEHYTHLKDEQFLEAFKAMK